MHQMLYGSITTGFIIFSFGHELVNIACTEGFFPSITACLVL